MALASHKANYFNWEVLMSFAHRDKDEKSTTSRTVFTLAAMMPVIDVENARC